MLDYIKNKYQLRQTKFSFGATSAIITNLGLIVGLRTLAYAKINIIGGILIIALADNVADSLGIHVYQESACISTKEVWISTFTNFISRIFVSLTFVFLVFVLPIKLAVVCSVVWGLFLLAIMSYTIGKNKGANPYLVVFEHLCIAISVIIASGFLGKLVISKTQV